jgi:hypothetical protein
MPVLGEGGGPREVSSPVWMDLSVPGSSILRCKKGQVTLEDWKKSVAIQATIGSSLKSMLIAVLVCDGMAGCFSCVGTRPCSPAIEKDDERAGNIIGVFVFDARSGKDRTGTVIVYRGHVKVLQYGHRRFAGEIVTQCPEEPVSVVTRMTIAAKEERFSMAGSGIVIDS